MSEDNVVHWGGVTRLQSDPYQIIKRACQAEMTSIVVIGFDKNGQEFFASSDADGGAVLWLLERAKIKLLNVPETHFGEKG